jgi:hypothetical protein
MWMPTLMQVFERRCPPLPQATRPIGNGLTERIHVPPVASQLWRWRRTQG